jgi:hypothetical protein
MKLRYALTFWPHLAVFILGASLLCYVGCKTKLEPGGAYAPTNGPVAVAPDMGLYMADAAFDVAYRATDLVFKNEYDNRDFYWKVSPQIKKTLDAIRPNAVRARNEYAMARSAYMAGPSAAGLASMQAALTKMQQIQAATQAAIAGAAQNALANQPPKPLPAPTK